MSRIPFFKYHGLGNDFVIIDRIAGGSPVDPAGARAMCDRNRGIGADGVLTLLPSNRASLKMHIRNADGSIAEMCGNGIRCAAKYAIERSSAGKTTGAQAGSILDSMGFKSPAGFETTALDIETGRGVLTCAVMIKSGKVVSVAVNMGAPILERPDIPMQGEGRFLRENIKALGKTFKGSAISMGNPHLVLFHTDNLDDAKKYGPVLENSILFPKRTNVEFAADVSKSEINVVVWERGCGITQACGTGACATAVAFTLAGITPFDKEITVNLPGGSLGIVVPTDLSAVYMRGPAQEVFSGTWPE